MELFKADISKKIALPLFVEKIPAGFPSPADGYLEKKLDLNDLMVKHPAATYFLRVEGDSMIGAQIASGDILVVDRAESATPNRIIVAVINGEFTVKRLLKEGNTLILKAENPRYPKIVIEEGCDFQVFGVVTYVIHKAI
jgi:DNA polymerase V